MKTWVMGVTMMGLSSIAGAEICNPGMPGHDYEYDGSFSSVQSTGDVCDNLFLVRQYRALHHRTGATGLTSVMHWRGPGGFLDRQTFVGRLGPDCDFRAEKEVERENLRYSIVSEGLVDRQMLFAKVSFRVTRDGHEVCRAAAEFTGFP